MCITKLFQTLNRLHAYEINVCSSIKTVPDTKIWTKNLIRLVIRNFRRINIGQFVRKSYIKVRTV